MLPVMNRTITELAPKIHVLSACVDAMSGRSSTTNANYNDMSTNRIEALLKIKTASDYEYFSEKLEKDAEFRMQFVRLLALYIS